MLQRGGEYPDLYNQFSIFYGGDELQDCAQIVQRYHKVH